MADLKSQIEALMIANRRTKGEYQYTLPSPQSYPYQWLWDSCFHAIILSYFNTEDAKKELFSVVAKQFSNGMIPHMTYWENEEHTTFPKIPWGTEDTSSITQPPMLAYAAWQIYQKDNDSTFLTKLYPSMKRFYAYFLTERDPRGHHLAGIINPDESGEDNSPRFDIPLGLPSKQTIDENYKKRLGLISENLKCDFDAPRCMKNFFWVKDVPLNAILVENLQIMSQIANELHIQDDSEYFKTQSFLVKQAMRELMLEDSLFWSTYGNDYQKIKVKTWSLFAPLFAKVATDKEAQFVVESYLKNQNEFATPYIIPTTALSEPSFDSNGFWRGPVWMSTNWFVYKGLLKYGYHAEAKTIVDSSVKLIQHSGFREQYNPISGEGYGAQNFTWGGLVIDMTDQELF